jgi:hypothetical protein
VDLTLIDNHSKKWQATLLQNSLSRLQIATQFSRESLSLLYASLQPELTPS